MKAREVRAASGRATRTPKDGATASARRGALAALLCTVFAPHAALAAGTQPRARVSGFGVDAAGCGSIAAPCRTLQYAHDDVVAPGGSIYVKDPANYGQIVIRQAISIINDGSGTATILAPSGDAIDVQVGASDSVLIKGLTLDGAGTGTIGVAMYSGGDLVIEDCTIQSFHRGSGVVIAPPNGATPTFLIDRARVVGSDKGDGVAVVPPGAATGQIRATTFANNAVGVYVQSGAVVIEDSVIEGLSTSYSYGLVSTGAGTAVVAKRSHFNGLGTGALSQGGASLGLSDDAFTHNHLDLYNPQSAATLNSYGDNAYSSSGGTITQATKQ